MLASAVTELPTGDGLLYEPKWDGFRCVGSTGPVRMSSKSGRPLFSRFPEIGDALADRMPAGVTLDGEIVRWSDEGRLDFAALLRRNSASPRRARQLSRTEPCHYVVFDVLELDGHDWTRRSLARRREALEELMGDVVQPSPLTLGWQTADPNEAMEWWEDLPAVGIEGLMIKDSRRSYRPGARGWSKLKHRSTTEAIVGGVIGSVHRPFALLLGRVDPETGVLRVAGRSGELGYTAAEEIAAMLHKTSGGDHPWPATLAPGWGSRIRQSYSQVEPDLVVEISPDTATAGGRWRHEVRYVRPRPDLRPEDVPTGLDTET